MSASCSFPTNCREGTPKVYIGCPVCSPLFSPLPALLSSSCHSPLLGFILPFYNPPCILPVIMSAAAGPLKLDNTVCYFILFIPLPLSSPQCHSIKVIPLSCFIDGRPLCRHYVCISFSCSKLSALSAYLDIKQACCCVSQLMPLDPLLEISARSLSMMIPLIAFGVPVLCRLGIITLYV